MALRAETGRLWLPLYADEDRIVRVFPQRGQNVVEMATGGEFILEAGGGYMGLASVKAGKKTVANQRIEITPMTQTLLLKGGARDVAVHEPESTDTLSHFVGPGI